MNDRAPRSGSKLGRYDIVRLLAVGGMAEIFLARVAGIAGFEKQVVIKRMLPHLARDRVYVDMFLNEARLAATLDHPNVAQVYDIGEDGDNFYYAMEYVRGADLRRLLTMTATTGIPLPIDCIAAIGLGMSAGIDYAHNQTDAEGRTLGIIHRDVTPSNVLVSYDGAVKITDFGVAKVLAAEATKSGIKGKIGYMSPEQCQAEPLDRRSDIFSIGIVLHELVSGTRLFAADADFATMELIVRGKIPHPSDRRAELSPAFEAIIMRALERDRDARYPTARDMQRDLEALVRSEGMIATPTALAELVNRLVPQASRSSQRIDTASGLSASPTLVLASKPAARAASEAVTGELEPPSVSIQPASAVSRARSRRRWPWLVAAALAAAGVGVATWQPWKTESRATATANRDDGGVVVAATTMADATIASTPAPADAAVAPVDAVEEVAEVPPDAAVPAVRPKVRGHGRHVAKTTARIDKALPHVAVDAGVAVVADAPKLAPVVVVTPPPPSIGSLQAKASLSVEVSGLADSEIRRGLDRAGAVDAFQRCYHTAAAAANKTLATEVHVTFEIDEGRAAHKASASGGLPGLASCVGQVVGQVRTNNAPDTGNAHVTLNVSFHPVP